MFSFQGRLPRQKYWLAQITFMLAAYLVAGTSTFMRGLTEQASATHSLISLILILLAEGLLIAVLLVLWWLSLTVVVRRWHDRGKSGAWAILGFLPVVGWLWQGIECGYLEGTLGPNKFGPSPKGVAGDIYDADELGRAST